MSEYKHRITLAVPEAKMAEANQLALIIGESSYDVNTFTTANWEDASGNKYSVCSTVAKPVVLLALDYGLPDPLPAHAEGADTVMAQSALDAIVMYDAAVLDENGDVITPATQATISTIVLAVDVEPMEAFAGMGLTPVVSEPEA